MTMNKEFVTFEQAVEFKKLLYGEHYGDDYLGWYSSNKDFHYRNMNSPVYPNNQSFIAPLKQQAFRWFREKYNILHALVVPIKITASDKKGYRYSWEIIDEQEEWIVDNSPLGYYSYEEAENACIDKLIEIVKQQDNGTTLD
jgi:hypothetical protein